MRWTGANCALARTVTQQRMGQSAARASMVGPASLDPPPWQCCGLATRGQAAGCDGRASATSGDIAGASNANSNAIDAARLMLGTQEFTPWA
jgi:hypothetical protein